MEKDEARRVNHNKAGRRDSSQREIRLDENRGVEVHRRNPKVHYSYASGRKRLFQYGHVDNNIQTVEEPPSYLRKAVLLIETHIDLKVVQYEDERDPSGDLPHQHLQSGVI